MLDDTCSECGREIEEHTTSEAVVCLRKITKKTGLHEVVRIDAGQAGVPSGALAFFTRPMFYGGVMKRLWRWIVKMWKGPDLSPEEQEEFDDFMRTW